FSATTYLIIYATLHSVSLEPIGGLLRIHRVRGGCHIKPLRGLVVSPSRCSGTEPFGGLLRIHRTYRGYLHRGLIKTTRIAARSISRAELLRRLLGIRRGRGGWQI